MRIGLFNVPALKQGADQLSSSVIQALVQCPDHDMVVINQDPHSPAYHGDRIETVVIPSENSPIARACSALGRPFGVWRPVGRFGAIQKLGLDMIVATPSASPVGLYARIPYVCWIADVMHFYHKNLPEYGLRTQYSRRVLYPAAARNSIICVGDSRVGEGQLANRYRLNRERVRSVPFIPPSYVYDLEALSVEQSAELLRRYDLPERFLFYPAQFWAHKNHLNLIEALGIIKQRTGSAIPLVLVGSDKGYLRQVQEKIHQLGMAKSVHHLGYISNSEMVAAYKRCTAVVFASIAGPTNIPPIEAIYLEVPLVCSNAYAMADQVGDAGLLFDPYNPRDMADKIQLAWENQGVREQLRARCGERRKLLNRSLYAERWREIVLSAATILAREGPGSRAAAASRQKRPSGLPSASEIQP